MTNPRQEILTSWTNLKSKLRKITLNEQEQIIFNAIADKEFNLPKLGKILIDDSKSHESEKDLLNKIEVLLEAENYNKVMDIHHELLKAKLKDFKELRESYINIKDNLLTFFTYLVFLFSLQDRLEKKEKDLVKLKEENKELEIKVKTKKTQIKQLKEDLTSKNKSLQKAFENLTSERQQHKGSLEQLEENLKNAQQTISEFARKEYDLNKEIKRMGDSEKYMTLLNVGIDGYKSHYREEPSKELIEWFRQMEKAFEALEREKSSAGK